MCVPLRVAIALVVALSLACAAGGAPSSEPVAAADVYETHESLVTAAEEGEPRAQFELGKRYRDGRGVPVDSVSAYTWLRLAEIHGLEDAGAARTKVAASMSADEIDRAEGLVRAWAAYFFQLTTKTLSEAELSGLRPRHYRLPPREEPGQGPATREALESGGQRERRN